MKENITDPIREAAQKNPQVAKAVAGLSGEDMAKLRAILNDPEKTRQVLASPMAQKLMKELSGSKSK